LKKFILISAACATLSATPSFAERWVCNFDTSSAKGWITPSLVAQNTGDTYLLADGIILSSLEAPLKVKARPNSKNKIGFAWGLTLRSASSKLVKMRYILNIRKDQGGKATIRAQPQDYRGNISATGICKEEENDPRLEQAIKQAIQNANK